LTELGNADLTDTQIRALRGFDFSFSTFGKTMPFFGNILPTIRSYSGIEYPQSHPQASFGHVRGYCRSNELDRNRTPAGGALSR
jgi:hypothetical protein